METLKSKTTLVGIVTLIVGLGLGLGIGVWGIKTSQASAPRTTSEKSTPETSAKNELKNSPLLRDDWDPFREMQSMQEEIDRTIRRVTERFQLGPNASFFRPDAGYSSSFDLRDKKDHFELRAYLPDVEASDVSVKIDDDRVLHVSVAQKKQETKKENGSESTMTALGHYEQVVTLPEPVKGSDMKIDRNGHELVITIPKAKSAYSRTERGLPGAAPRRAFLFLGGRHCLPSRTY
jgi:HSP20 family protein